MHTCPAYITLTATEDDFILIWDTYMSLEVYTLDTWDEALDFLIEMYPVD